MSTEKQTDSWVPLPALLENAKAIGYEDLHDRLAERGFDDIRHAHGCVFRWVDPDGTRLTELAELAGHSKQAVGEFVCDLEVRGYVERIPDPADGRAKIIRLTDAWRRGQRGRARDLRRDRAGVGRADRRGAGGGD